MLAWHSITQQDTEISTPRALSIAFESSPLCPLYHFYNIFTQMRWIFVVFSAVDFRKATHIAADRSQREWHTAQTNMVITFTILRNDINRHVFKSH